MGWAEPATHPPTGSRPSGGLAIGMHEKNSSPSVAGVDGGGRRIGTANEDTEEEDGKGGGRGGAEDGSY